MDRLSTKTWDTCVTKHNADLSVVLTVSNQYLDNALLERVREMKEPEKVSRCLKEHMC